MRKIPTLLLVAAAMTGCESAPAPDSAAPVAAAPDSAAPGAAQEAAAQGQAAPAAAAEGEVLKRGAAITATTVTPLATVLASPKAYEGKVVLVNGTVRKSCSRKGCWMELAAGQDTSAPGCRVTFKDYGFFVPLDAAGSIAKVEGTVTLKTVSKEHVEHLESEGGEFAQKNPDGSANEVQIVATGVELTRG